MSSLQRAAKAAIKSHGTIRKAAAALGLDHANLYRISKGVRRAVTPETAAKLGLAPVQSWRRLWFPRRACDPRLAGQGDLLPRAVSLPASDLA